MKSAEINIRCIIDELYHIYQSVFVMYNMKCCSNLEELFQKYSFIPPNDCSCWLCIWLWSWWNFQILVVSTQNVCFYRYSLAEPHIPFILLNHLEFVTYYQILVPDNKSNPFWYHCVSVWLLNRIHICRH